MAVTSKSAQTADNANFIHGCFMVRVGTDFSTFLEVMQYAEQDELNGNTTTPGLDPAVKSIFDQAAAVNGPLPLYFSRRKCRDSSLGGNDAINPLPQFSIDDDISHPHYYSEVGAQVAMGQIYSENYDDTQQVMYMGFGIPLFTNVGSFWGAAVDMDMANFMNKGSGITDEKIGYLIGSAPARLINIATIPFKFIAAMVGEASLQQVPISKYYAFSSQMPMYFRFVNTILVMLATNMNMMGSSTEFNTTGSNTGGTTTPVGALEQGTSSTDDMSGMSTIFSQFGLDIARIMTKRYLYEKGNQDPINQRNTDTALFANANANNGDGVTATIDATTSTNPTPNPTNNTDTSAAPAAATDDTGDKIADGGSSSARAWSLNWVDGFKAAYSDAIYDGHMFVGFRIDEGSGASESFSNSTGESQISQTANAKFQEGREGSFDIMNGNIGSTGITGVISSALRGASGLLHGVASAFKLDPLAATMSGAAKIIIPEVWTNSSYSRSASFSMTCMAPYGDMESIFASEYVPLACLLAGTLPRGTGYSSHAAPFICQAYCRGIFSSPLAMIESLEVTRGADQFGFTAGRLPLKLSIHVTLKDLSPVMYMNMAGNKGIVQSILGQEDNFGEYMLTLSGMGLRDRLAPFKSMRRKLDILLSTAYKNKLSPFMLGMEGGSQFFISRMISAVVAGGRGLPGN